MSYTVYYETYLTDYHRANHVDRFESLNDIEEWMFGSMKRSVDDEYAMTIPCDRTVKNYPSDIVPNTIKFRPERGGSEYWIHKVENDYGIVYSDGKFTSGHKHWSKEFKGWLNHCDDRRLHPKYNFVE